MPLDADPNNYMSYYRRATVFLALSRSRPALADLDKVISLKADFINARVQRANVLLKMGRLDEAHIDVENVLRKEPENKEANRLYTLVEPLTMQIRQATDFVKSQQYEGAVQILGEVLEQVHITHIISPSIAFIAPPS